MLGWGASPGYPGITPNGGVQVYINVKRLRLQSGIGQRELARRMGVTAKIGRLWDQGSQPRSQRLPLLAEVLGCDSVDELYDQAPSAE